MNKMSFLEIVRMALGSLGVNKLRSFLTMSGITIGVFSIIGVMTAVSALRSSIETGISFLGTNIFQFGKFPVTGGGDGSQRRRYQLRRDITLAQAMRYQQLMAGNPEVICLKAFDQEGIVRPSIMVAKPRRGYRLAERTSIFLPLTNFRLSRAVILPRTTLNWRGQLF